MTADLYAIADERDPIGSLRAIEERTGMTAIPRGRFVRLVPRTPDHAAEVVQFVPGRGLVPAFLRAGSSTIDRALLREELAELREDAPFLYSFDADGPKGAA